jgi:hypothetical protein
VGRGAGRDLLRDTARAGVPRNWVGTARRRLPRDGACLNPREFPT